MLGCNERLLNFCEKLGFSFKKPENLYLAFTHASMGEENYERLEFLGDSVLKLVISDYLFKKYESEHEGKLTSMRAEIVSDKTLTTFAKKLEFEKFILMGKAEGKKGKSLDTIMACVFEAFLGVIYLEYGPSKSIKKAYDFIFKNFNNEIENIENNIECLNPKAILQEYSQGKLKILPEYQLIEEKGPEHNKVFKVAVKLNDKIYPAGVGSTKKEAQKSAAKNAIAELGLINTEGKEEK